MIRVLVAADSELSRAGLESLIVRWDAVEVVGRSAAEPAEIARHVRDLAPDVLVVESRAGDDARALAWLGRLGEGASGAPIVLVGGASWESAPFAALAAGVRAVVASSVTGAELRSAVEGAAGGLFVLAPDALDAVLGASGERGPVGASAALAPSGGAMTPPAPPPPPLTPRELDVLRAVTEGLANKQIAARLGISSHTVKTHLAAVFQKLGASSRAEAVTLGARRGVLHL
ncbi:MAG TPA: response regulator transcription factor [Gemmatimonadaceae bacterium]